MASPQPCGYDGRSGQRRSDTQGICRQYSAHRLPVFCCGEILRGHGPHAEPEEVPIPQPTMDGTAALFRDLILASHGEPAPNMPTLHDGLAAVAIVEAAFESNEKGQRVETGLG